MNPTEHLTYSERVQRIGPIRSDLTTHVLLDAGQLELTRPEENRPAKPIPIALRTFNHVSWLIQH